MGHLTVTLPTTAGDESATIFLAVELSRSSWLIAVATPASDKVSRHKLAAGDAPALLALIARKRHQAERVLGRALRVASCYEAGYDGFWLDRVLRAGGVVNHVIDPASLEVNRRARRAKTDRIDVGRLLRALIAYLRGERHVCSMVRVPSVEEEDAKRLHRERGRLVKERTQHTNRIKGLLAVQGIYDFQPRRRDARARLARLETATGQALPPRLAGEIERQLERLELIARQIAELEAARDAQFETPAQQQSAEARMQHLARLKGIGPESATALVREVFYRGFDNRRQLGAYVGLCGSPFASGATSREQGISKAGNPRARTVMVELAWLWLRYQPQSALSQWFQARLNGAKGRLKRILIVALARKLLVALWRYQETGLVPEGAIIKV